MERSTIAGDSSRVYIERGERTNGDRIHDRIQGRIANDSMDHEIPIQLQEDSAGTYSKRLNAIVLIVISGVFIVSIAYIPLDQPYFTICGFKALTGLPCPGCGLTHSFCAIGKGEFLRSLGFNPFGPFLFALTLMVWARSACVLIGRKRPAAVFDTWVLKLRVARNTVILMTVYGVGRIVWLLIYPSSEMQYSPLLRLVAWLKG